MSDSAKLNLVKRIAKKGSQLALTGIYHQFPNTSKFQVRQLYLEKRWGFLGSHIEKLIKYQGELMLEEPIWLVHQLATILDSLKIPYYVSGSVASSLQGEVRFTEDLDLAIEIESEQVQLLIDALSQDFYISEVAVYQAIEGVTNSFNVIHLQTTEKAAIFISRKTNFDLSKMSRRQLYISDDPAQAFYVCSPEDTILQKLIWFKMTESQSQKQWRDILGVFKLQRDRLNWSYLGLWSKTLGVKENILKAMKESGLTRSLLD
ncbi:hypothetical protein [Aphanothece hegewaldii]|uniref:hypothetical protein n=1 Tax=Aphanothece hegewaldii TaxID=1521625 RepID=UPI001C625B87|nr:hypothetical protein [Aphanothece hegewaldii]